MGSTSSRAEAIHGPAPQPPSLSSPPTLSLQGLTKRFGRKIAVNDVYLDLHPGEIYGLIGPNGAGKTTLMEMMVGAIPPSLGEIWLAGQPLRAGYGNPQLRRSIGYLPDDYPLYDDLTVWQYLSYFARLYGVAQQQERLYDSLELVQLTSKRHSRTTELSRGMKQRLGLARAIIHQPDLLVLDEPVSGLDPVARMEFRSIIKALQASGMTILISSHVLSDLADFCTTIGILELGHLVENAPLEKLYQRLSREQIFIGTLGDRTQLSQLLEQHPAVRSHSPVSEREVCVELEGGEQVAAELLRSLIDANIPICQFNHTHEDLETIFLKHLDHKQVS